MDAVGRLAGGMAGDFNNVLTVLTGYAELLRADLSITNASRRFVDEIVHAGERAAALTRHLLAFSQDTSRQSGILDLNALITGMEPMLRRLVGDTIELLLLTSPGLGRVKADPAQIEQVIVNLTTNARDAMAAGGKLVIETADVDLEDGPASKNLGVKPGSYVMLAVSDTGIGMDSETRSRLFEPFFTTKPPGHGSGLGLATVYGAIKQSDGQVSVYSQPGCGTIFEIYLPRVTAEAAAAIRKPLADIVMPQMTGIELGKQLLSQRSAKLKVLYMSGYRDNAWTEEGNAQGVSAQAVRTPTPSGEGAGGAGRSRTTRPSPPASR